MYLNALHPHLLEKTTRHTPATHIVVEHSDLYAMTRLIHQCISYKPPHCIVLENIELHMDMVLSPCNGRQQCLKHLLARRIDLYPIALKGKRLVGQLKETD